MLIYPGLLTDAIGLGLIVIMAVMQMVESRKEGSAAKA